MNPILDAMDNVIVNTALCGGRVYRRASEVLWNLIDGEAVLLGPSTGACYGLNATAVVVWELLETPVTVQFAAEEIVSRFDVSLGQALEDTKALLDDLLKRKLIEIVL